MRPHFNFLTTVEKTKYTRRLKLHISLNPPPLIASVLVASCGGYNVLLQQRHGSSSEWIERTIHLNVSQKSKKKHLEAVKDATVAVYRPKDNNP